MDTDRLLDGLFIMWRFLHQVTPTQQQTTLTPEQFWLLRQIWWQGSLTVGELAEVLRITPSSVTIACKRLEKVGLVTRGRQAKDERVVRVTLTSEAVEVLETWLLCHRKVLTRLLGGLEPHEREELVRLVERVREVAVSSTERPEC